MLVSDLLHSCANDRVAAAAVLSIGGDFASRVQALADEDGVTMGEYTSRVVRAFALGASEREWRDLVSAVRGEDLPVLAGLQLVVHRTSQTRGSLKNALHDMVVFTHNTATAA